MKAKRTSAAILALLFLSVMLFSLLFIAAEADHDCSGEDCSVCRVIALAEEAAKGSALPLCLAVAAAARFAVLSARRVRLQTVSRLTPVLLKDKLSD